MYVAPVTMMKINKVDHKCLAKSIQELPSGGAEKTLNTVCCLTLCAHFLGTPHIRRAALINMNLSFPHFSRPTHPTLCRRKGTGASHTLPKVNVFRRQKGTSWDLDFHSCSKVVVEGVHRSQTASTKKLTSSNSKESSTFITKTSHLLKTQPPKW